MEGIILAIVLGIIVPFLIAILMAIAIILRNLRPAGWLVLGVIVLLVPWLRKR